MTFYNVFFQSSLLTYKIILKRTFSCFSLFYFSDENLKHSSSFQSMEWYQKMISSGCNFYMHINAYVYLFSYFFLLRKFDLEHKNNLPKFIKRETWRISLKNLKKAVGEWDGKLLLYSNIWKEKWLESPNP